MQDFPVFTTEYGVASLFLKEIPYRQEAYIRVLETEQLSKLLEACLRFCRMAGAERIYAAGHTNLERWPLHLAVVRMQGTAWVDREKLRNLFPVTEATVDRWRKIYNERMLHAPGAGTLERRDETEILESGGAYFVHQEGELLGIGWLEACHLRAMASVKPGAGEQVMHTLMSMAEGAPMTLETASTNLRAIQLYEKLGFGKTAELVRWYEVG